MNARKWSKRAINALTVLAVLALTVGLTHAQGPEPPGELDGLPVGFNGDGCADLAIGVTGEDVGTIGSAGAVNVLYGSVASNGLTASGDEIWHQDVAGVVDDAEEYDSFGSTLALGDFDGDGYADLAIGVPYESVGATTDAGAVNILYGMAYGLESEGSQMWHQDISGIAGAAEQYDYFGDALAVGDFDGDGYDDLAIGVPEKDMGGFADAGAVNVIYGSGGGLTPAGDQLWYQGYSTIEDMAEESDQFGSALAAGDFDGDGYDDLAIGVSGEDVGTIGAAGAINVLYGSGGGLTATGDQLWHQDSPSIEGVAETNDRFGSSLAVGDFDGDGYDDLAIGVPGEDVGAVDSAGAVNVLYGSGGGLAPLATNCGTRISSVWWMMPRAMTSSGTLWPRATLTLMAMTIWPSACLTSTWVPSRRLVLCTSFTARAAD